MIGDLHKGVRNDSPVLCEHQLQFFENVLFPYMKKHKITTIIQLGDLFDRRKYLSNIIFYNWKMRFYNYMRDNKIKFITLLGNHDVVHKNTNEVNSQTLYLSEYKNIVVVDKPTEYVLDGMKILLLPWITVDNETDIMKAVEDSDARYCAGHFEFEGFEIQQGLLCEHGRNHKEFDKFEGVFSGHFHTQTQRDNVHYIGIPYPLTWIDYGEQKGCWVIDGEKQDIEFLPNPYSFFIKVVYDDLERSEDYLDTFPYQDYENAFIRVIVANKTNPVIYEKFIDRIVKQNPADLKINDEIDTFDEIDVEEVDIKFESTESLIDKFIEQIDTHLDKSRISRIMRELYIESLHTEE